jgi:Tol biopolymer transport system component
MSDQSAVRIRLLKTNTPVFVGFLRRIGVVVLGAWLICLLLVALALLIGQTAETWVLTLATSENGGWRVYALDVERDFAHQLYHQFRFRDFPVPSPDRRYVAFATVNAELRLLDSHNGRDYLLAENVSFGLPGWSPLNSVPRLVYQGIAGRVYMTTIREDGRPDAPFLLSPGMGMEARGFVWSPDGAEIAYEQRGAINNVWRYDVYRVQADGENLQPLVPPENSSSYSAAWSPTSESLAFIGTDGRTSQLYVADQNGEVTRLPFPSTATQSGSLVWSPDGTRLAFATFPLDAPGIFVADLASGQVRQVAQLSPASTLVWSPDGERLAFVVFNGDELYIVDADSGKQRRLQVVRGSYHVLLSSGTR